MNANILSKYILKQISNSNFNLEAFNLFVKKYNLQYLIPSVIDKLQKSNLRNIELNKIKLISPVNINEQNKKLIENKYGVEINEQIVDKRVIAGYKLYTKEKILDASLENLLKKLLN